MYFGLYCVWKGLVLKWNHFWTSSCYPFCLSISVSFPLAQWLLISVAYRHICQFIASSNVKFFTFIKPSTSFPNLFQSPSSSSSSLLPFHYSLGISVVLLSYNMSIPFQHMFSINSKIVCVTPIFSRIAAFHNFYSLKVLASDDLKHRAGGSIATGKASMPERS